VEKIRIAPAYSDEYLEIERPSPMSDNNIERLQLEVLGGNLDNDITDNVYINFKAETEKWITNSNLNNLTGLETFFRKDIIIGCTQFIDTQYMKGPVQIIEGDYRYHSRLNPNIIYSVPGRLKPGIPLIIAMPFPSIGAPHIKMKEILNESLEKSIPMHVDGAWISCCRDINFSFAHPAIQSVGISLSKGLGLGWNRIGLRWTRDHDADAITIMNDFHMNNRALAMIGLHFIRNLPSDYLWLTHGDNYYKVCKDFGLTPTNSIYLALRDGNPVGVSPLLRYLENVSSIL
jgi:hypothetical protein